MSSFSTMLVFCSCFAFVLASAEIITPIWLSPLNASNKAPEFQSVQYEWTNITTGVGGRAGSPVTHVDSKGTIWIIGGYAVSHFLNAVWNYDPRTDLYRWVAGRVDDPDVDHLILSEFGVPNATAFPGYLAHSASAIDQYDNIWMYGCETGGMRNLFWRFNTTSFEFTNFRVNDTYYPVFSEVGVPSPDNYPGYNEGSVLVVDSHNNLWLIGGGRENPLNSVWHFNTTSLMWTFVWGKADDASQIDFKNKVWNGRWKAAGTIDTDDRIWLFGGDGREPAGTMDPPESDWGDMWSFDTKTLQWRVEWGSDDSFMTNGSLAVIGDFNINNYPRARTGAAIVDRKDGTLLVGGGMAYGFNLDTNDYWLFNKTSKRWKLVYGDVSTEFHDTQFTHYRAPGSVLGSRYNFGVSNGIHNGGNLVICGGEDTSRYSHLGISYSDIWVFPQDQCVGANNDCDSNAACTASTTNYFGHTCTCNEGYVGNGKTCILPVTPSATSGSAVSVAYLFAYFVLALVAF